MLHAAFSKNELLSVVTTSSVIFITSSLSSLLPSLTSLFSFSFLSQWKYEEIVRIKRIAVSWSSGWEVGREEFILIFLTTLCQIFAFVQLQSRYFKHKDHKEMPQLWTTKTEASGKRTWLTNYKPNLVTRQEAKEFFSLLIIWNFWSSCFKILCLQSRIQTSSDKRF